MKLKKRDRVSEEGDASPPPVSKKRVAYIFNELNPCGGTEESITTLPPSPRKNSHF